MAPAMICPVPPMLNRPPRKPRARASPAMMSGREEKIDDVSGAIWPWKDCAFQLKTDPRTIAE